MLSRLRIDNLVLIRDAELAFAPGLNVITGETGAGKTILAQAFGLLLGTKGDAGYVGAAGDDVAGAAERLVAMSGQFEQRRLARPAYQLDVLDAFAGPEQLQRRGEL